MIIISLEPGDLGSIHYDDAAIDNLLDRNRAGLEEKSLLANEYLASFKVGLLFFTILNTRDYYNIGKQAFVRDNCEGCTDTAVN